MNNILCIREVQEGRLVDKNRVDRGWSHHRDDAGKRLVDLLRRLGVGDSGTEGRRNLLPVERAPVHVSEPGVVSDLGEPSVAQPTGGVSLEEAIDDIVRLE